MSRQVLTALYLRLPCGGGKRVGASMNGRDISTASEWRRGWTLVLASSVGFSFFSVMLSGAGLFMGPLGKEFHWSKTLLSGDYPNETYEHVGNYTPFLIAGAIGCALGGAIIISMPRYPAWKVAETGALA